MDPRPLRARRRPKPCAKTATDRARNNFAQTLDTLQPSRYCRVVPRGDREMVARVLKGCNCCLSRNRAVRFMGQRARIAYCRRCHAKTVWDAVSDAEREAYEAHVAKMEALIEELADEA
jgi:hypothetical protein